MTTHHDIARQLQMKMAQLRGLIAEESEEAADHTRRVLDWKYQIASHPLITAAVAIAVGYWLIPRRNNTVGVDSLVEMRTLLENQRRPAATGMGKTLALAAGSMLLKSLTSGAVSRAIASFGAWRDQSSSEYQASVSKSNLTAVNEGNSDDD